MRSRKAKLKPETFPFLAVLLCAMGALILLLLVMDRRAKIVSQNKARLQQAQRQQDTGQEQARRHAEDQRRQDQRNQLNRQAADLLAKLQATQAQEAVSTQAFQSAQTHYQQIQQQVQQAGERVRLLRDDVAQRKRGVFLVAKEADHARSELAEQLVKLQELEATLNDLKTRKQLDGQTYSLIPYAGKHGDNRKPLYVECRLGGLVFHPDRLELNELATPPPVVRAEVERRINRQGDGKAAPAYVMVLIRPNGILSYGLLRTALDGLDIDFGYELVEADWVLDFSADALANGLPPVAPAKMLPPVIARTPKAGGVARINGVDFTGSGLAGSDGTGSGDGRLGGRFGGTGNTGGGPGGEGGSVFGGPGKSTLLSEGVPKLTDRMLARGGGGSGGKNSGGLMGSGGRPGFGTGVPGFGSSGPGDGSAAKDTGISVVAAPNYGGGGSARGVMAGGRNGGPGGGGIGFNGGSPPGGNNGNPANNSPGGGNGQGQPGSPPGDGKTQAGSPTGTGKTQGGSPGTGNTQPDDGKTTPGDGKASPNPGNTSGDPADKNATKGAPPNGPGNAGMAMPRLFVERNSDAAGKRPPVTLSGLIGNRDWIIPIACEADVVVLRSTGQRFSLAELTAKSTGEHPLTQAVRQLVARRQATVRPGETPYRPLLRFQVAPAGLATYYLAYPLLEPLRLPWAREGVN